MSNEFVFFHGSKPNMPKIEWYRGSIKSQSPAEEELNEYNPAMTSRFIHLNLHSEFSLFDGLANVEQLAAHAAAHNMQAFALTDQMNLFGLVKFYHAARGVGAKPLVGSSIYIENRKDPQQPYQGILLCQNSVGYRHLSELISQAYLQGQLHGKAILKREWIAAKSDGLIFLSGAQGGDVGRALLAEDHVQAQAWLAEWKAIFSDRYYLELQRVGQPNEEIYIQAALQLAAREQVPVVATNAVRFLKKEDFEAHEARVAIHEGYVLTDPKRPKNYTPQQFLRSGLEMESLFKEIPSAIDNTAEIARRCNVILKFGDVFLPNFPVPEGHTVKTYISELAHHGLTERLNKQSFAERSVYEVRLESELKLIVDMGFTGYFLIVADFIQWARDHEIPVGPGRGSGAGSLVAYVLKITDLDPIRYELLFERFLNPERVSMPDFDIDFCVEGRDRVIDYVAQKYGRDAVSQIITYGTMAAKAVIRDVGRILDQPYGFVDTLAKLIPFEVGMTLTKAFEQEPLLQERYKKEEEVAALFNLARKLEGVVRNVGKHAGGVVIAPSKLTDFMPIYCEADESSLVSQFDKDDVEAVGLVKFDFLGLRTLTIIDWAVRNINARAAVKAAASEVLDASVGELLDIALLPLDDTLTYDLLKACHTTAVFQLESRGMKDLIKRLQPDCFDDIVSLVALFRPGPLQSGMVDDFINRKHGRAKIEYQHPLLEPILKSTYGVIVYQEQVMQIAQSMGGYTLGGADLLRRAMGKKKPEEMATQRLIFVNGAIAKGIDNAVATHIFDLMEKFAGYGFNKSHSVAYALLAYQTAWLKAHYLPEFMAAVMSSDLQNTDKIVIYFNDCKQLGLTVLSPDLNESAYKFTVAGEFIRYGLGAIKGVGEASIEAIAVEREMNGPFSDLFSFCQRVGMAKLNRRVLEALIKAGAMDSWDIDRATLFNSVDKAIQGAEQAAKNKAQGQVDLFAESVVALMDNYMPIQAWTETVRLMHEKSVLGLFLSGHPLTRYEIEFASFKFPKLGMMQSQPARNSKVALLGSVARLRTMQTKKGDRMAFMALEDSTGEIEMAIFSDLYEHSRESLQAGAIVVIEGEYRLDNYSGEYRFSAAQIWNLGQWRARHGQAVLIKLDGMEVDSSLIIQLKNNLQGRPKGNCPLWIDYKRSDVETRFELGGEWRVFPSDELLDQLQFSFGINKVNLILKETEGNR
jgi:DNA polymerase-3 subunit alpha